MGAVVFFWGLEGGGLLRGEGVCVGFWFFVFVFFFLFWVEGWEGGGGGGGV